MYNSYAPNRSGKLRRPPPREGEIATEQLILDTLPNMYEASQASAILWILSSYAPNEVYLGQVRSPKTKQNKKKTLCHFDKSAGLSLTNLQYIMMISFLCSAIATTTAPTTNGT
jgi:hypothetical protein